MATRIQDNLESGAMKADRKSSMLVLDAQVYAWVCENQIRGIPVRGIEIRAEAKRLADELNIKQFCASNGWLWRFKNRHGINSQQCNGSNGPDGKSVTLVAGDTVKKEIKDEENSGNTENSYNLSISDVMLSRLYNGSEIDIFATPGNLLENEEQKVDGDSEKTIHSEEEEECVNENNEYEINDRTENNHQIEHEMRDLEDSENPVVNTKKKKKKNNGNPEVKMNNKSNVRGNILLNKNAQSSSKLYLEQMLFNSENITNLRKHVDGILQILDNTSDSDLNEFYETFNKFRNIIITKQRKRKSLYTKDSILLEKSDIHKIQAECETTRNCPRTKNEESRTNSKKIKLSKNNATNGGNPSVYVIDSDEDND